MTAAAVLARTKAAGGAAALDPDGQARVRRASLVPPETMDAAWRHREDLAWLLTKRGRAAFLRHAAHDAAVALGTPDPDLARESAEMAATLAAEARGGRGRPVPLAEHQQALTGLRGAALKRLSAWSDPASVPAPGCRCACCGFGHW